jgi:hypothetical protein
MRKLKEGNWRFCHATHLSTSGQHVHPHGARRTARILHHGPTFSFVLVFTVLHTEDVDRVGRHFLLSYDHLEENEMTFSISLNKKPKKYQGKKIKN